MPLDRTDFDILAALQDDGRLANKQLAARVGLAPSSCSVRVARLRDAGVLRGAHADVEPRALGIGLQAMISIQLRRHAKGELTAFMETVAALPEVVALHHMAGANDFLVHVAVRDSEHLRHLVVDAFTTREDVAHLETSLIFEYRRAGGLPVYRTTD